MSESVERLHPAYFSMVMSTGIVSIAFDSMGYTSVSRPLFFLNIVTYAILVILFGVRTVFYTDGVVGDLRHPRRCWGFFTFVVGTNTLGSQFHILGGDTVVSQALWVVGLASWAILMYAVYTHLIIRYSGPLEDVVSGATLLTVVSTQSVTVLGSRIAHTFGEVGGTNLSEIIYMFCLTHFAAGWVLYLIIIILVVHRLVFVSLEPIDWEGPYWICMGAVAITTLAGSSMLLHLDMGNLYEATLVITYLAWAIGVWWLPIQIYLDIWKFYSLNVDGARPLWVTLFPWARLGFGDDRMHFYESPSWGRVFPMGMFTAATIALSEASGFDVLYIIPAFWGWFALVVWVLTFIGTTRAIRSALTGRSRSQTSVKPDDKTEGDRT